MTEEEFRIANEDLYRQQEGDQVLSGKSHWILIAFIDYTQAPSFTHPPYNAQSQRYCQSISQYLPVYRRAPTSLAL